MLKIDFSLNADDFNVIIKIFANYTDAGLQFDTTSTYKSGTIFIIFRPTVAFPVITWELS